MSSLPQSLPSNPQYQNPLPPRAPSVLLQGPPGTGKTHSIVTIMEQGVETFYICTEPNGLETLLDAMRKRKIDPSLLHYKIIEPSRPGFTTLHHMARRITEMGFDSLSKLGPTERSNAQFLTLISTLNDFIDERTGQGFGPVSKFPSNVALVLDSLSGVNIMAMDLTIGDKVTAHVGEWGIAMNMLDKLILSLTSNLSCMFVLTAHIEPERDEITGGTKLMSATLGRKLAPKIPRFFSEVILTHTEGDVYYWSTSNPQIDLKHRALPRYNKLQPSFKPILENYQQRLAFLSSQPMLSLPSPGGAAA